ncbi:MAG TPA: SH3 domain-containing protein [Kiritimatiellia bacterium]|nr:SH3 domain-containing protein [Kiritimatiellia bacterium]
MPRFYILLVLLVGLPMAGFADTQIHARVNSDRVNLRAKSDLQSETVGQVAAGTLLKVRSIEGDWVQVIPPAETEMWVHREFLKDDVVLVNRLNVRSGAGINYNVVGSFARGDRVVRRGSFGEWVKVAPPEDASIWVYRNLVDLIYPAAPVPPPVAAPPVRVPIMETSRSNDEPVAQTAPPALPTGRMPASAAPAPPADLNLIPLDGQGRIVQKEGQLKRSPVLHFSAPGAHRLVIRDGNRLVTTAYLRGNTRQLDSMLDQYLIIQGREYWVDKVRVPVVVIESIERRLFHQ